MPAIIHENKSLKMYNTMGVDVTARYFVDIDSVPSLQALLSNPTWKKAPIIILGDGSNVLFTHDINGLVIHIQIKGIDVIKEDEDHVYLKVGAGENWHQVVMHCLSKNYAGIENLSLIPGTVGAGPIQNIGAYGVELKDVVQSVETVSLDDNQVHHFDNAACQFGYRDSIFKHALKNKHIITQVTFRLNKKPVFHTEYGAIQTQLGDTPLSIQAISDAIIHIRQSKLPDPFKTPNAGSFFKNPIIPFSEFTRLQKHYPAIPHFLETNGEVKIPAAWLIEQCGFKGKCFGAVGVHDQQALVLINCGNATGMDIQQLGNHIQKTVNSTFCISLQREVNIY